MNNKKWLEGDVFQGIDQNKFIKKLKENVEINKSNKCNKCNIAFACIAPRCGFKNVCLSGKLNMATDNLCRLERILYKHNNFIFEKMYIQKEKRFMKLYNYAKNNGYEFSDWLKKIH